MVEHGQTGIHELDAAIEREAIVDVPLNIQAYVVYISRFIVIARLGSVTVGARVIAGQDTVSK